MFVFVVGGGGAVAAAAVVLDYTYCAHRNFHAAFMNINVWCFWSSFRLSKCLLQIQFFRCCNRCTHAFIRALFAVRSIRSPFVCNSLIKYFFFLENPFDIFSIRFEIHQKIHSFRAKKWKQKSVSQEKRDFCICKEKINIKLPKWRQRMTQAVEVDFFLREVDFLFSNGLCGCFSVQKRLISAKKITLPILLLINKNRDREVEWERVCCVWIDTLGVDMLKVFRVCVTFNARMMRISTTNILTQSILNRTFQNFAFLFYIILDTLQHK